MLFRAGKHSAGSPRRAVTLRWTGVVGVLALTGTLLIGTVAANATTARPDIGFANSYVVLGKTAVTVGPLALVEGTFGSDLGLSHTAAYTISGALSGVAAVNIDNAAAKRAQASLAVAYGRAMLEAGDYALPGELNGATLTPGIYTAAAAVTLTGNVTLDAQNDPNAIFIMVTHSAFDTSAGARVHLVNGAQAGNVYWFIGGAFTIAADADFSGRIIGGTAGTLSANSTLHGQLLTTGSIVTLSAGARIINDAPSGTPGTVWNDQTLAPMTNGTAYSDSLSVVSSAGIPISDGMVTYTVTAGALPAGLTLDSDTGVVSGTPNCASAACTWSITATIVGHTRVTKDFTTAVTAAPAVLPINPTVAVTGGAAARTRDSTPTISGTTSASDGSAASVLVGGASYPATVTAGTWSVTTAELGADAAYPVVVTVHDGSGVGTAAQDLTLDTAAPSISFTAGAPVIARDSTPTISGVSDAPAGTAISVAVGSQSPLAATVDADGAWSVTAANIALDGGYAVTATVTDDLGNTRSVSAQNELDRVRPTITIDGDALVFATETEPTISGTSNAGLGTLVTVTVDDRELDARIVADGTWSVVAPTLAVGEHAITASVSDAAGNTSAAAQTYAVVETVVPDIAVTVIDDEPAGSRDPTPTFGGMSTAAPGSTVTVTVAGQTLTTTVAADGSWLVRSAAIGADGSYSVVVDVVDAMTGARAASASQFTMDTTAPAVAVTGGPTGRTRDTTPTLTGTTDAPVGAVLSITVAGQRISAVVQPGGTWTITPAALGDGTYELIVTATDALGNSRSAAQSFRVVTTPPENTTPAQTVAEGAMESLVVTGTTFDPGESVQVWMHSTPVLLTTLVADENGNIVTSVIVPTSTPAGLHHIVMIGVSSSTAQLSSKTITVTTAGSVSPASDAAAASATTELATTGVATTPIGGAALLLVLAGALALVLARTVRHGGRRSTE